MAELIDAVCTRCWGKRKIGIELDCGGITCPRCRGTGEEPDTFSWPAVILCVIIFVVGLYFVWSVK